MGSLTTEIPGSTAGTKSKRGGAEALDNEAIGLDVSVRIHGSQVTAIVLDTTEHVEPFEEDTSTMIVFPRGAVVKLKARVRTGHAVVLTNLATKQTALCKIIQVNSTTNAAHYVKLEFNQPEPGFWGVHFPSDGEPKAASPVQEEQASSPATFLSAPPAAPLNAPPPKAASRESFEAKAPPVSGIVFPRTESKPRVQEAVREPLTPAPLTVSYGAAADVQINNEIVPLAAAPTKRTPAAPKIQTPAAAPQSPTNSVDEAPIFDSLSTGDEIFGKETAPAAVQESSLAKADARAVQAFGRSLDPSSLMQSVEMPKRHTGLKILLSAAAVVIIGAGAAFYVRQYRGNTRKAVAVSAPPASTPQTIAAAQSTAETQAATAQSQTPTETATAQTIEATPKGPQAAVRAAKEEDPITVTPVHSVSRNSSSEIHPTISTGLASIYAGDLTARPKATQQHSSALLKAAAPSISTGPGNMGGVSPNALGSLVSGSATENSALPKPVEPKPLVRGGFVSAPKLIHRVQPIYPSLATASRTEGDVEVEALIDQTGKVTSTKAISGPVLLRGAAMDAVRQWRYSPALLDGKPISMQYKVTVSFHLSQ